MKIFFVTALLLAFAASGVYSQACHMRELDLCMAIGMFHYQSNGIPPDEEKVNEWCETMTEVQDCMGNYSAKCLSPLQREVVSLLAGAEEDTRQLCIEGSETRARYLTHSECLSNAVDSDDFRGRMKDLQAMIEKMFDVPFKQRFPLMCCGFRRFCSENEAEIESKCGKAAVEMARHLILMVTTELPQTICQGFDPRSEECQNILPPNGTPTKGSQSKSQLARLLDTVLGSN